MPALDGADYTGLLECLDPLVQQREVVADGAAGDRGFRQHHDRREDDVLLVRRHHPAEVAEQFPVLVAVRLDLVMQPQIGGRGIVAEVEPVGHLELLFGGNGGRRDAHGEVHRLQPLLACEKRHFACVFAGLSVRRGVHRQPHRLRRWPLSARRATFPSTDPETGRERDGPTRRTACRAGWSRRPRTRPSAPRPRAFFPARSGALSSTLSVRNRFLRSEGDLNVDVAVACNKPRFV